MNTLRMLSVLCMAAWLTVPAIIWAAPPQVLTGFISAVVDTMKPCPEKTDADMQSQAMAVFNASDNVLSVPQLQVDDGVMFYNTQLKLDFATGQFKVLNLSNRPAPLEIQLGCEFTLTVMQYARLPGTDLNIDGLVVLAVNDSRCPANADCIWAGEVNVGLETVNEGEPHAGEFSLTLGDDAAKAVRDLGDYRLTLLAVSPYPDTTVPTHEQSYQIKLRLDADIEE